MNTPTSGELDRLILDSAQEANILPIISRCGEGCVFCSHKNNPPEIAVHSVGARSVDEVARTIAFLDPGRVITIGESATTIIEGEPLAHPRFREILALVRRVHPVAPVEVTTNGGRLTAEMVEFLESVGDVTVNVSLNSASARGRLLLMGEGPGRAERAIEGVRLLGRSTVAFSGSLVAMPHLVGWEDIRETVEFLAANGATVVRVVTPAFSGLADAVSLAATKDLYPELRRFVEGLPDDLPCPVLLEPSCPGDLVPRVSGVLKASPAWEAGVRRGDVFESVGGRKPRCRVEAWQWLAAAGPVSAVVDRAGAARAVAWTNPAGGDAGVTMEYDFDPGRMERLAEVLAAGQGRSLLLTSVLGHAVVTAVLKALGCGPDAAQAAAVTNRTFGGTIAAAGLLTVDDYLAAYEEWRASAPLEAPEPAQIILPQESFDRRGFDLKRVHASHLQRLTGVRVLLS